MAWVNGGSEPNTVQVSTFNPNRLLTLKTRNSAAYKGVSALLMRDGGVDFVTGEPIDAQMYADDKIDIHHIFPQDWCDRKGVDRNQRDSIVNKTPISARTNRKISNNPPSIYLRRIEDQEAKIPTTRMDEILKTHVIEPGALRTDDFDGFFESRWNALLDRIQQAMGKPIPREILTDLDLPEEFVPEEDEQFVA